jgi:hypothetical protein
VKQQVFALGWGAGWRRGRGRRSRRSLLRWIVYDVKLAQISERRRVVGLSVGLCVGLCTDIVMYLSVSCVCVLCLCL